MTRRYRVILLTRDSAYSRLFLDRFMARTDVDVVGMVLSTAYLHRDTPWMVDLPRYIGRVGLRYALYQAYVAWVLPRRLALSRPLKGVARDLGFPVHDTDDVNGEATMQWIDAHRADLLLSFHFNQRLDPSVIGLPSQAAVNFHPSLLPAWRGVDPVFFSLQAKATEMGCTLHLVSPVLDEGDILLQERVPVPLEGGLVACNCRLFEWGGEMAARVVAEFADFQAQRQSQGVGVGDYFGWRDIGSRPWGGVRW